MKEVFYAMSWFVIPRWYFFLVLSASFGMGIFFTIVYAILTGKVQKW